MGAGAPIKRVPAKPFAPGAASASLVYVACAALAGSISVGRVIAAAKSGKVKTACTMVGLCLMMVFMNTPLVDTVVTWVIVVTTLYSGIEYFVKNWKCLGL